MCRHANVYGVKYRVWFNKGLNLFNGNVEKIPKTFDNKTHKIPFIGWSKLKKNVNSWESTILEGITSDDYFYFVINIECKQNSLRLSKLWKIFRNEYLLNS